MVDICCLEGGSVDSPDSELAGLTLKIRMGFGVFRGDSAGVHCALSLGKCFGKNVASFAVAKMLLSCVK